MEPKRARLKPVHDESLIEQYARNLHDRREDLSYKIEAVEELLERSTCSAEKLYLSARLEELQEDEAETREELITLHLRIRRSSER